MLMLMGALVIVVGSFWITMIILDYWNTSAETKTALEQPTYDLAALQQIEVGQTLEFGVGKENRALLSGWANPEPEGIWSLGKNSTIGFVVRCKPAVCNSGHLAIHLEGGPYVVDKHPKQTIVFWMGTKEIFNVTLTQGENTKVVVNLDGMTMKDGSPIILSLQLPDAISPANIINSLDTRELAYRIKNLRLTP